VELGQELSFIASSDCETLRFTIRDTAVSKIPKSGGPVGPGRNTYKVVLTEREWNAVVAESGATLTWVVTGRTSAGVVTRMVTTNELTPDEPVTIDLSTADAKLVGEEPDDQAGFSVSGAGDVDGDGHPDLLIGAYNNDEGGSNAGAAYLVRGPVMGTLDLSRADAKLVGDGGTTGNFYAGWTVSGAGDVDADGHDDLLVGAKLDREGGGYGAGAAYLVRGPVTGTVNLSAADAKLLGEEAYDYASYSLSGAGDVDGDGHDDVLVGAPGYDSGGTVAVGAAYLLDGPLTGTIDLSLADAKFVGAPDADGGCCGEAGLSVSDAGDMDGDGNGDILISQPGTDGVGVVFVVHGPLAGILDSSVADAELWGEGDAVGGGVGWTTSGAGDVDGDGHLDLLIGAPYDDEADAGAGAAYLVLGPVTGTKRLARADAKFLGEDNSDQAGTVSGAGDVDRDGHDDVLIGSHFGAGEGAAYLVLGPAMGTVDLARADVKLVGETTYDYAGESVAGVGDVDGDGHADMLLGAREDDDGGSNAGAAYLVYGGSIF
jgi:hypothetical protein